MSEVYERSPWLARTQAAPRLDEASRHIAETVTLPYEDQVQRRNRLLRQVGRQVGGLDLERLADEETIRLVYKLFITPDDGKRQVVLFAGIERDNGCAAICARAGRKLAALQPGLVCLVDANLRSPSLHELVGTDNRNGLATADGSVQPSVTAFARPVDATSTNNLWVLPSGSSESDPATLLTPARLKPRLRALCGRFDFILISAPPADLHAESLALGQVVDGVVLVVSANATRRDAVHRVTSRLEDLHVPVLGLVLNDRTFPIPEALYRLV